MRKYYLAPFGDEKERVEQRLDNDEIDFDNAFPMEERLLLDNRDGWGIAIPANSDEADEFCETFTTHEVKADKHYARNV